ncbi:RNA polymerase sigma factor [Sandaracinus amylolyticus]|uniref:RNA polymerase sigma factor n=1 Tax=Sandaracinus amylolyticus TaxID=927083 RepID=UPI0014705655|nr:RNA polymerase sigma factor [Sandaracinus amylolyticus]
MSDAELVVRALGGDRWAQEAIFRRYVADVTSLAERLLRRRHEADDVVQDTFADALLALGELRDPSALRAWLLGIAVRRVRRRVRKLALLRTLGLDRGIDDATLELLASPGLSPDTRAELARVDRALARLHPDDRIAWMLRHVEGEKLEDVAAIVGCSLATAKRRIAAAETLVRARLREGEP